MNIGVLREQDDSRVSISPEVCKKLISTGYNVCCERGAGEKAGFSDVQYTNLGVEIKDREEVFASEIVTSINPVGIDEIAKFKSKSVYVSLLKPHSCENELRALAEMEVTAIALELIPRTSRAQSMDVLSSQANIAGYRAVLEATINYRRFFPMMMTSAGMARPAKVIILGVGVAGLQAIATAKRLGANVEAYDIRPEVKEQVLSLGAKFIDLQLEESGVGAGGYAKELSEEGKEKQKQELANRLKKADVIITTANVPGRKAPQLVGDDVVAGMREGSVIVDMAAESGGNCSATEKDKIVTKNGIIIVGITNFPQLVAGDASLFFGNNIKSLTEIMVKKENDQLELKIDFSDDILDHSVVTHDREVRFKN